MPQIGEICQPMAAGVGSVRSPIKGREVCMCRFGTHTPTVSMSLAEIDDDSRTVLSQRGMFFSGEATLATRYLGDRESASSGSAVPTSRDFPALCEVSDPAGIRSVQE